RGTGAPGRDRYSRRSGSMPDLRDAFGVLEAAAIGPEQALLALEVEHRLAVVVGPGGLAAQGHRQGAGHVLTRTGEVVALEQGGEAAAVAVVFAERDQEFGRARTVEVLVGRPHLIGA